LDVSNKLGLTNVTIVGSVDDDGNGDGEETS
jgi:hypothetical protein